MKDALRNDLVIGQRYGYFSKTNSYFRVRVGVFTGMTPKGKASLDLDPNDSYDDFCDQDMSDVVIPRKASVTPIILFPLETKENSNISYVVTTYESYTSRIVDEKPFTTVIDAISYKATMNIDVLEYCDIVVKH